LNPSENELLGIKFTTEFICNEVQKIGFSCKGCADCCRDNGNIEETIFVGPEEIRDIASFTKLEWDEIVTPFPEIIKIPEGGSVTFGWSLKRKDGACLFLVENRCSIYEVRPRICATYPFMIDEDHLVIFPCNGLTYPIERNDALEISERLMDRFYKENKEDKKMQEYYLLKPVYSEKLCVIDSEGIKERELWLN